MIEKLTFENSKGDKLVGVFSNPVTLVPGNSYWIVTHTMYRLWSIEDTYKALSSMYSDDGGVSWIDTVYISPPGPGHVYIADTCFQTFY